MRLRCTTAEGDKWVGSKVVRSTSPSVRTQTSALLPPRCIEAMLCCTLTMRASPPGSTRQERGPSDSANTRSMTERGEMRAGCPGTLLQVGICDSGM